jgi:uncharacterized membrane protein
MEKMSIKKNPTGLNPVGLVFLLNTRKPSAAHEETRYGNSQNGHDSEKSGCGTDCSCDLSHILKH